MEDQENPFALGPVGQSVLRNTTAFTDRRYHGQREEQVDELVNLLLPLTDQQSAPPVAITGEAGSGKTTTIAHVLTQLEQRLGAQDVDINRVSIRGLISDSHREIYGDALMQLDDSTIVKKSDSTAKVRHQFYEALEQTDNIVIVHVASPERGDAIEFLHELVEGESTPHAVIAETTDEGVINELGARWEHVRFPRYTTTQIEHILTGIANRAFHSEACSAEAIEYCAAEAVDRGGSAAQATVALRRAGQIAAQTGAEMVRKEHVKESLARADRKSVERYLDSSTPQHRAVIAALVDASGNRTATVDEIKEQYDRLHGQYDAGRISKRTIRRRLQEVVEAGVAEVAEQNEGVRGGRRHLYGTAMNVEVIRESLTEHR